jgi:hypothetical protein
MPSSELALRGDGAADRVRRPRERREEPVSGGVSFSAAEPLEVASHDLVVVRDEHAPPGVAEFRRDLRRSDDVGEQRCSERSVRAASSPRWSVPAGRTRGKRRVPARSRCALVGPEPR